jgi:transposase
MKLTDCARHLPEEVWQLFEPLLPPVVWCGHGRPPASNYDCVHAVCYVLVSGIAWRRLPKGFPSYKTVQRRRQLWLQREAFRTAWPQLAHRYEALQGINWDQRRLDGAKKPAQKGANRPAPVRSSAASAARLSPSPVTPGPCRSGPS